MAPEPHQQRSRRLLAEHPAARLLVGRNPATALFVVALAGGQLLLAWALRDAAWWLIAVAAFTAGAVVSHALWTLIHECAHSLVFRRHGANQWLAILANVPHVFPSAASFCRYHLRHHRHQGRHDLDADLPSDWEARLIGRSFAGKLLWEVGFPLFQSLRTIRLQRAGGVAFLTPWVAANIVAVVAVDVGVLLAWGPAAFVYLLLASVFAVGPHPLGARWIQEHFVVHEGQETYSYYGVLNRVSFNVGMHNEHHDVPRVPWNRLPALRALAPEMYDSLYSHSSWTRLWLRFLFDPALTLHSRVTRPP
jgi:sphingolipid delta-4 desaturase